MNDHYPSAYPELPTTARDLIKRYVDSGKLGRKTGEGFFKYG